jgi:hypothetical protein
MAYDVTRGIDDDRQEQLAGLVDDMLTTAAGFPPMRFAGRLSGIIEPIDEEKRDQ